MRRRGIGWEGRQRSRRLPARLRAGGRSLCATARERGRRLSVRLRAASGEPGAPARAALRALAVSLRQVRGSGDADGGGGERRSPGTPPIPLPPQSPHTAPPQLTSRPPLPTPTPPPGMAAPASLPGRAGGRQRRL
uniref:CASP-like protein 4A2 n=1 Tax=Phascolarctos cinereus TaxID=38626 RepID=A0A6P5ICU0_PHACI|nr:CASP-like protein 4A2 [Phascolarctos cinereus]